MGPGIAEEGEPSVRHSCVLSRKGGSTFGLPARWLLDLPESSRHRKISPSSTPATTNPPTSRSIHIHPTIPHTINIHTFIHLLHPSCSRLQHPPLVRSTSLVVLLAPPFLGSHVPPLFGLMSRQAANLISSVPPTRVLLHMQLRCRHSASQLQIVGSSSDPPTNYQFPNPILRIATGGGPI
jgi:hypothetical protein